MSEMFRSGDLLLYFNNDVVHLVLLDEVDLDYFIVITSVDEDYQYGYKIKIQNLTEKYFLRLDQGVPVTKGHWETYEHISKAKLSLIIDIQAKEKCTELEDLVEHL